MSRLDECRIINLQKIENAQGSLSPLYGGEHIPFPIGRVYYVYDVPGGAERGGHAHHQCQEFIVAVSGAFSVVLDDGQQRKTFALTRSYYGLYVAPMVWRELNDFCTGAVCLVFASMPYDEKDYVRRYDDFLKNVRGGSAQGGTP